MTLGEAEADCLTMPLAPPRTVADIDMFIELLRAACNDSKINATLENLLSLPDTRRQALVHTWVTDMMIAGAPPDFIQAVACLMDDAIAEKAYEAIYNCRRGFD